jgi:hypothetical protein
MLLPDNSTKSSVTSNLNHFIILSFLWVMNSDRPGDSLHLLHNAWGLGWEDLKLGEIWSLGKT